MFAHIGGDIGHFAQHWFAHRLRPAVIGTVIKKAPHAHEQIRIACHGGGKLQTGVIGADDDDRAHFTIAARIGHHAPCGKMTEQQYEWRQHEPGQHQFAVEMKRQSRRRTEEYQNQGRDAPADEDIAGIGQHAAATPGAVGVDILEHG
ncbi:hypothetical protein D3C72_1215940 [compost metagenome]